MSKIEWDQLWINAQISTMQGHYSYGLLDDAAIAVSQGKIVWLGKTSDLPGDPQRLAKKVTSLHGTLITPTLIDCHTHLVYAGHRFHEFEQRLQGKTYAEIARAGGGIQSTVKATRLASEDELFEQSLPRARGLVNQGVRVIEIKSGYGLDLETELKMLRVAKKIGEVLGVTVCPTFLGAHALPVEYQHAPDRYIDTVCDEMIPAVSELGLATTVDAFCEGIGFSPAQVERVFKAAEQYRLRVKCHAEQLSNLHGAELAAKFKALSADHLEFASKDSVKAMAESGTVAVLLPGAFYFLRETQSPPIDLFRQYNVPIAIATDCNPGSAPTNNLLLMMNMACTFFGLTVEEALLGVTKHAAHALGLPDQHGCLREGDKASFIIWDVCSPAELVGGFHYSGFVREIVVF